MNKKYIIIFIMVLAGMSFSACSDFLEPKSNSEFVPKDAEALNQILLGEAYPPTTGTYSLEAFVHLFDDDLAMAPYQDPLPSFNANRYKVPFTWQPDLWNDLDGVISVRNYNIYYSNYEFILGCNAVMDYIGQAGNDSQDDINNVLAQAHALRAFYYFNLVNIFGAPYNYDSQAPGVPLKLSSNIENKPLSRSTVAEVYDLIVDDLTTAVRLYESLPEARQWKADFRTSLPMAQLLLSRVYLYMERWDDAAVYAKKVMDNPHFSFMDLNSVDLGSEAMPEYPTIHGYSLSPECIWPYGRVGDVCLWLTESSKEQSMESHSYFIASPELMNSFDDKDLRKKCYVITGNFFDEEGNRMPQAIGKVPLSADNKYLASGSLNDFGRSMRLSEAYLNYAEARVMGGHPEDAVDPINQLRKYRFAPADYVPVQDLSGEAGKQFVRDERRRELCFESHRWFDLRRWGMPRIKHVWYNSETSAEEFILEEKDPQYTMPLPTSSLESNPQLTQNVLGPIPRVGNTISYAL